MILGSSGDAIAAVADALAAETDAPLQPIEIDTARGIEVDHDFGVHVVLLPIQAVFDTRRVCYTTEMSSRFPQCVAAITIGPVGCGMPPAGSSVTASIFS